MLLHPAEKVALAVIAVLFTANLLLDVSSGAIDWASYASRISFALIMLMIGLTYRVLGRSEPIALVTIATALFILFTLFGSIFNYLLFPLANMIIDEQLARIDAYVGYSWPGLVAGLAEFPLLGALLGQVYLSSLFQFVLIILLLGFTNKAVSLHRFLLTGMFGALAAIGIWWLVPSFGPSAMYEIPDDLMERVSLVVQPSYGAELLRLAANGPIRITPEDVLGVIAFPSFHTVMACMAVWFTFKTFAGPGFLLVNVLMLPAILAHGGHHLVDVLGGMIVFALALYVASLIVPQGAAKTAAVAPVKAGT